MSGRLPRPTRTLKIGHKRRTQLEGVVGLAEIAARKNPAVDAVLTAKDIAENVEKIVYPSDSIKTGSKQLDAKVDT